MKSDSIINTEKGNEQLSYVFVWMKVAIVTLLLAPMIMGFLIVIIGNVLIISARIADQQGYCKDCNTLDEKMKSLPTYILSLGALFPIGGIIGALSAGKLNEIVGRRLSSTIFILFVIFGSCLKIISFKTHFSMLYIGRFFDGIAGAGIMSSCTVLMFESANMNMIKFLKPMVQISINFGILLMSGLSHSMVFGEKYYILFIFPGVFSIFLLIAIWILPESPSFLYNKYGQNECYNAIKKVHKNSYMDIFAEVKKEHDTLDELGETSVFRLFTNSRLRRAMLSAIILNCCQQLCGINAIIAFCTIILSDLGISQFETYSLIIISSGLIGSIIFAPIVTRYKRKTNLIISHSILALCLALFITLYLLKVNAISSIFFLGLFVFIFQLGPGPILWFLTMEIFPPNATSSAYSVCVAFNWASNAIVFGISVLGIQIMYFYMAINIFVVAYMIFYVAETLGKSPGEILNDYESRFDKYCLFC